jgi:prephenate dehydrogenase
MRPRLLKGKTIAIVGAGQIGGSIIRCLAEHRPSLSLLAFDRNRRLAARVSRCAEWRPTLESDLTGADVVILSLPIPDIIEYLFKIGSRHGDRPLLVLDTGSTKSLILQEADRHRTSFDFVGLHPLAGTEKAGWDGSDPAMFDGHVIVHCPTRGSGVAVARELIRLLHGRPVAMAAGVHDRLAATAIGLPHLLAFAAQGLDRGRGNLLRAGSWESLTRVAASDPAMVAGLLSSNAKEMRRVLRAFKAELTGLEKALGHNSPTALTQALRRRRRRDP